MKLNHYLTPYMKINSECIRDLNMRPSAMKFLEENIGSKLLDVGLGNDFFFDLTPNPKTAKAKVNRWDYINFKHFCIEKEIINKMKKEPTEWENIFASHTSNKRLISKICKELL